MDKFGAILLFAILQLSLFSTIVDSSCCNGRNSEVESDAGCNRNCRSECDCSAENCDSCSGAERCCQTCCNTQCNCQSVSCNTCSGSTNECCSSCCSNKCSFRSSGCSSKICRQCNCDNCNTSRQPQNSGCCNSCCNATRVIERFESQPTNVSQITTLPNITIIINHAPIYVNNTPVINSQHTCGNASVLTNGTHIVYVYPQNSTCNNRTCCSRMVRQRCHPVMPPMPPSCPPPVYVSDCSSRCMYPPVPPPPPPPMPIPPQPCQYFMNWPFVHCPQTNCYGFSCAPPPMPMQMPMQMPMPMPMPMVQPASMYAGCIPFETWPFLRCIPGMTGDSTVSYGAPSTQILQGAESAPVPFINSQYGYAHPPGN